MGKVNRINVVFLYAQDFTLLRKFYEAAFDLSEKLLIDAKWWVEYELGDGTHFALHQAEEGYLTKANRKAGTVRFSVDVTNIFEISENLKTLGAVFHYEPTKKFGFYLAEFEDPEGNVIRLYEKIKR